MNTLKIFPGGTPKDARDAYKAWWDQQRGIELVETPVIEAAGAGFKVSVWHRPTTSN
ncbi:MAG TPA: hypothetical protein VIJ94_16520 [Caulobacteraceae bacterium]